MFVAKFKQKKVPMSKGRGVYFFDTHIHPSIAVQQDDDMTLTSLDGCNVFLYKI